MILVNNNVIGYIILVNKQWQNILIDQSYNHNPMRSQMIPLDPMIFRINPRQSWLAKSHFPWESH